MPTPHYGQPRYRAIAGELRELIADGTISHGTPLPPESTLTVQYRASRGTIRKAIAVLREEGLVTTEHGRASFVRIQELDCSEAIPGPPLATNIRRTSADAALAAHFGVQEGTPLVEIESLICGEGRVQEVVRRYRLEPFAGP